MSFYAGRNSFTNAVAGNALFRVSGETATVRAGLCSVTLSSDAAPSEAIAEYQLVRFTTLGSGAAGDITIYKLDTASPASQMNYAGGKFTTGEPAVGDVLLDMSLHQKAFCRWHAYPGREILITPATNAGVGAIVVQQTTAFSLNTECTWME
jgi:hypothetical protein